MCIRDRYFPVILHGKYSFDREVLVRERFSGAISSREIDAVLDEIEDITENFRHYKMNRLFLKYSMRFLVITLILGFAISALAWAVFESIEIYAAIFVLFTVLIVAIYYTFKKMLLKRYERVCEEVLNKNHQRPPFQGGLWGFGEFWLKIWIPLKWLSKDVLDDTKIQINNKDEITIERVDNAKPKGEPKAVENVSIISNKKDDNDNSLTEILKTEQSMLCREKLFGLKGKCKMWQLTKDIKIKCFMVKFDWRGMRRLSVCIIACEVAT
eukprot:TRINITY_DN27555_c0_g1_i1.p1 TRINITY_DN27555_c0_g1~~TRINITY_DN27555_c0_g1_i1.p1  ORF type:complete len:287 (+),score=51.34 TRINITY_DN27555_c0_g1_i1:57-863(+)